MPGFSYLFRGNLLCTGYTIMCGLLMIVRFANVNSYCQATLYTFCLHGFSPRCHGVPWHARYNLLHADVAELSAIAFAVHVDVKECRRNELYLLTKIAEI
jgi:hypothetical protein